MMNRKEGEFAVKLARNAIELWVKEKKHMRIPKEHPRIFSKNMGAFTTIHTYPDHNLRGCIGIPYPEKPLVEAIVESAVSATMDPRFPELRKDELDSVVVEVSILTNPEKIVVSNPEEYLKKIKIGRDGLIIKRGIFSGLLLPIVPVEQRWNVEEFLVNLCYKAGLPPDAWFDRETEIYKFQSIVFAEKKPRGKIIKLLDNVC
ncbi:MAG: TIGR00296 family protein [Candidatus Aenigmarchaeota archaeon]|nr:TIGR00296 family protein [Candidatus Aenigmarchaeota archaeon]